MTRIEQTGARAPFKFLALIIILAFIAGCRTTQSAGERRGAANRGEAPEGPVISITTVKTEARNTPAVIQATGSLVAQETSNIAPKVAGKVANVMANVG